VGKIDKAINIAREQRDGALGIAREQREGALVDAQGKRAPRTKIGLPVIFQLQGYAKHKSSWQHLDRHHIVHNHFSEKGLTHYKMLRTRVLHQLQSNDWRTIAITATHRGAGKTVIATNLAITLALSGGHDIYLLDLDLRNPGIAECFGMPDDSAGLGKFLAGRVEHTELLWDVGIEHLKVLPSWGQFSNSSELITSQNMVDLLHTITSSAKDPIVLLDLPPMLTSDDAIAIFPMVDAVMLVVSEGESSREDVVRARDLLRDANILGAVLNKAAYL